jgi:hypothetical protein
MPEIRLCPNYRDLEQEWRETEWFPFIEQHPTYPWYGLSSNPNLTLTNILSLWNGITKTTSPDWQFLVTHQRIPLRQIDQGWNWREICKNPTISLEMVNLHPEIPWNWKGLSQNPNNTLQVKNQHPSLPWDLTLIHQNPSITPHDVINNPSYNDCPHHQWIHFTQNPQWNDRHATGFWSRISRNPVVTWEKIQQHKDRPWNYSEFSHNPNLTITIVANHPELEWDWEAVSSHPNITMRDVTNHPHLPWKWRHLSSNPNLNWKMVSDHINKDWDWKALSKNPMTKTKEKWIADYRLRLIKALQIHRHWRCCTWSPEFALGRRKIIERSLID